MGTPQINDLLTGTGDAVVVQEQHSVIDLQNMEWQNLSSSGTSQPDNQAPGNPSNDETNHRIITQPSQQLEPFINSDPIMELLQQSIRPITINFQSIHKNRTNQAEVQICEGYYEIKKKSPVRLLPIYANYEGADYCLDGGKLKVYVSKAEEPESAVQMPNEGPYPKDRCVFDLRNTNNTTETTSYYQEDTHRGHIIAEVPLTLGDDLKICFKKQSSEFKDENGLNMLKLNCVLEDKHGNVFGTGSTNLKVKVKVTRRKSADEQASEGERSTSPSSPNNLEGSDIDLTLWPRDQLNDIVATNLSLDVLKNRATEELKKRSGESGFLQ